MVIVLIILGLLILAGLIYVFVRNNMVSLRNRCDEAWSGIDVQLKRRHDLVPNLVEAVKGYAAHESQVFERATKARADAMSARGVGDTAAAESKLSGALTDLRAVAENYPQLRATENFQQLQNELTNTEDQIAAARRIYNGNVQSYNTKIQVFPNSLIAGMGGFTPREYFEIEDPGDREPVKVDFSTPPPVADTTPPAAQEAPAATPPATAPVTAEPPPTEPPPSEPPPSDPPAES